MNEFISKNGLISKGNVVASGSITATLGFNGNLTGTSSWASNAVTSSYIDAGNITTGTLVNTRLPSQISVTGVSGSFTGSFNGLLTGPASTASYIDAGNITTGTLNNSRLPSQINVTGVSASFTGSLVGSLIGTSSWASNAVTSSYIDAGNITTGTLSNSRLPSQINVTGVSASFLGNIIGNVTGTSSWASNSITSSYIDATNITTGTLNNSRLPSQINVTGVSASFTGSLVGLLTGTSSWASNAVTSSYIDATNITTGTLNNSRLPSQINVTGVSASFTGSLVGSLIGAASTASYIDAGNITTGTLNNSRLPSQINVTGVSASFTGSLVGSISGGFVSASSVRTSGDLYIGGNSTFIGDVTFFGSSSTTHISSSIIDIGSNKIILNAFSPLSGSRYGGISIVDSGSQSTSNSTSSLYWDSQYDYWLIQSVISSSASPQSINSSLIVGTTTSSFGSEIELTLNTIPKVTGFANIGDSQISDNGTVVTLTNLSASNYIIAKSFSGSFTGSLTGIASTASYIDAGNITTGTLSNARLPSQINVTGITASLLGSGTVSTASYIDAGNITTGTLSNSRLPSQINVTGYSGSFTGSLTGLVTGTSSWSSNAVTSSYIDAGNITTGTLVNARLPAQINVTGYSGSFTGSFTGLLTGPASTASYIDAGNITTGTILNARLPAQINVTGYSGSFTGSFTGIASTASYIDAGNITTGTLGNARLPSQINVTGITASLLGSGTVSTASYIDAGGITTGTLNNSRLPSQINVTGYSGSFTGSLTGLVTGTSSWSSNAVTASYALTSSYLTGISGSYVLMSTVTGSIPNSSSIILNSYFIGINTTASLTPGATFHVQGNISASSVTASLFGTSTTASYIDAGNITTGTLNNSRLPSQINVTGVSASFTGSLVGSLTGTSSWSSNAVTSSYALTASYINTGTTAFVQGGNSFGATGTLGTNDNNLLNIRVNSSTVMTLSGSNVGIGTTSPGYVLDVQRAGGAQIFNFQASSSGTGYLSGIIQNTGGQLLLGVVNSAAGSSLITSGLAYASVIGSYNSTALQLATNSAARVTIDTTGNIGIGTTSPTNLLRVQGVSNGLGQLELTNTANTANRFCFNMSSGTDDVLVGSAVGDAMIWTDNKLLFSASTGNAAQMVLNNSGYVGIGITTPSAKLNVNGGGTNGRIVSIDGTNTLAAAYASFDVAATTTSTVGGNAYVMQLAGTLNSAASGTHAILSYLNIYPGFTNGGATVTAWRGLDIRTVALHANVASGVGLYVEAPTVATANYAAIFATGNVGIGTTGPGVKFHASLGGSAPSIVAASQTVGIFQNSANTTDLARVSITGGTAGESILQLGDSADDDIGAIGYSHAADSMVFRTNNASQVTILSTGNVGIGTTSPGNKLNISASGVATTNGALSGLFVTHATDGSVSDGIGVGSNGSASYKWIQSYNGALSLNPAGNNVGIGTTVPTQGRLHITSAADIALSGTAWRVLQVESTSGAVADKPGVILGFDTAAGGVIAAKTDGAGQPLGFWTYNGSAWGERARISKEGYVGIGTTAPTTFRLQVSGSIGPNDDNSFALGSAAVRFSDVFAVQTTIGGLFESGLRTENIGKSITGTIVVWSKDGLISSYREGDELVMGVIKNGKDEPIIIGAESILISGKVEIGDYIITSNIPGHGKAVKRTGIFKRDLFGKVIAQALESGSGSSFIIKAMIRKM